MPYAGRLSLAMGQAVLVIGSNPGPDREQELFSEGRPTAFRTLQTMGCMKIFLHFPGQAA